jgi:hypothetical protein
MSAFFDVNPLTALRELVAELAKRASLVEQPTSENVRFGLPNRERISIGQMALTVIDSREKVAPMPTYNDEVDVLVAQAAYDINYAARTNVFLLQDEQPMEHEDFTLHVFRQASGEIHEINVSVRLDQVLPALQKLRLPGWTSPV